MSHLNRPPTWREAADHVASLMSGVPMYMPEPRNHDEPPATGSKIDPGKVVRVRYATKASCSKGTGLRLYFTITNEGVITVDGWHFSDVQEPSARRTEFAPGTLTAETLKHFLWAFHSGALQSARGTLSTDGPSPSMHWYYCTLLLNAHSVFRYEQTGTIGTRELHSVNACIAMICFAYRQSLDVSPWSGPDYSRLHRVSIGREEEGALFGILIGSKRRTVSNFFYHLHCDQTWWPWFQEFDVLNSHFRAFGVLTDYDEHRAQRRLSILAEMYQSASYRALSAWVKMDALIDDLAQPFWDDMLADPYPASWDDQDEDPAALSGDGAANELIREPDLEEESLEAF